MESAASEWTNEIVMLLSAWGLRVLGALAVLLIGRWVAGLVRRSVRRGLERSQTDASLVPFLAGLVYYGVLAVVLVAVLNLFGIQTASLIALIGAAGLAVGLAMQGTLGNFAAGVMLLLFRPFRAGDYVDVAGAAGTVAEIGIFSTALDTPDNVRIVVPNGSVYGQVIRNYSAHDTRRADLTVSIAYGDDIGRAIEAIREALAKDARVLREPESLVAVSALGESSVDLVVRAWCRSADLWPLRFDLNRHLKEAVEAAGCTIPFPQRDVHLVNGRAGTASA